MLGLVAFQQILAPKPADVIQARSYIQAQWDGQTQQLQHPKKGKDLEFWERNCLAGFKRYTPRGDPQSYEDVLRLHTANHLGETFLNAKIPVIEVEGVDGGYAALVYTAYRSVTKNSPFIYHELQQQFWIKTRMGYGLKSCQVLYWHSFGKNFSIHVVPQHVCSLWKGSPLPIPPGLLAELNSPK